MRPANRLVLGLAALAAAAALFWFSRRVLLLTFSGMLIALIFTSLSGFLGRFVSLPHSVRLVVVLLVLLGTLAFIGYLLAPGLATEFSQLANELPKSIRALVSRAEKRPVFHQVASALPKVSELFSSSGSFLSRATSVFSSTFDVLTASVLVVFVALFLAANPNVYKRIVLNLVPAKFRQDAESILARLICTLKYWLLGQFISMCMVGLLVGIAFWACGLPLSASLGVLAGLGEFIPFVGPLIAAIPALLLALNDSGKLFLIVMGVYLAVQFIEGHLIMPLVQRRTVDLPPVLTLLAVFFMGNFFGLLGMFVAAPLTAVLIVLIEEIYLQRFMGENRRLVQEG